MWPRRTVPTRPRGSRCPGSARRSPCSPAGRPSAGTSPALRPRREEPAHPATGHSHQAEHVRAQLDLDGALGAVGDPVLVGSAALGLMAWRDLDITVVCPSLDKEQVLAVAIELAASQDVKAMQYRDDSGRWNQDPEKYPDGLCRVALPPGSTACLSGSSTCGSSMTQPGSPISHICVRCPHV